MTLPALRVSMHPADMSVDLQPYVGCLAAALRDAGVQVEPFRTAEVIRRPPDVIHFHWPEHTLNHPPLRRIIRGMLRLATLALSRRRGAVLVLTAHNVTPHDLDAGPFGEWFLDRFDRLVDGVLVLTVAGWKEAAAARPRLAGAAVTHTRHGHFRDVYPAPASRAEARRRLGLDPDRPLLVFVGQVRPYKGVPALLEAARSVEADLLVAGSCRNEQLRRKLNERAASDPGIHLRLRHLENDELVDAVAAATVVVLPYRNVLNSGTAMLALSLGRPVMLPATPTFQELRSELGEDWVRLYCSDQIGAADLERAIRSLPGGEPDLTGYEWDLVAEATIAGYRKTVAAG